MVLIMSQTILIHKLVSNKPIKYTVPWSLISDIYVVRTAIINDQI